MMFKTRGEKTDEGGAGKRRREPREPSPPSSPQGNSVVKQQKKERAFALPHRKQARSGQVSTNSLEIWGAGGRPPLNQFCNRRRSGPAAPSGRRARPLMSRPPGLKACALIQTTRRPAAPLYGADVCQEAGLPVIPARLSMFEFAVIEVSLLPPDARPQRGRRLCIQQTTL